MRCKNCGWPNKPNETSCVKCHTPLNERNDNDEPSKFAINGNKPGKTIFEGNVFVDNSNVTPQEPKNNSNICPKCGYPIRAGIEKCPNCNFQINETSKSASSVDETSQSTPKRQPTRIGIKANANSIHGTVNPYMMNLDVEPSFILKPLKRDNERHELTELEYEGKNVILNRSNTEENNVSITSQKQAVITNEDGLWYIEDTSEQKTTFVQAAKKIELHDGDIILLGNRLFEFHK